MSLRALLFDVDGTLADTEKLGHRPAYNKAFKELGLSWSWGPKLYRRLLRQPGGRERLHHYLHRYDPELGEHAEPVRKDSAAWVNDVHKTKSRHFRSLLKRGRVPLRPGVARLMHEALDQELRLAIVTNASRATLEPVLQHSLGKELRDQVEVIVCGEDVAHKKPAPDLYLRALDALQLPASDCVALEDSAMGLRAATAAGLATVITVNDNTAHEDFSAAMMVVDALGEPEQAASVLQGDPLPRACVDIAQIRDSLQRWWARPSSELPTL